MQQPAVLAELFAVVGGDDDHGVAQETDRLELVEQGAQRVVDDADLGVVEARDRVELARRQRSGVGRVLEQVGAARRRRVVRDAEQRALLRPPGGRVSAPRRCGGTRTTARRRSHLAEQSDDAARSFLDAAAAIVEAIEAARESERVAGVAAVGHSHGGIAVGAQDLGQELDVVGDAGGDHAARAALEADAVLLLVEPAQDRRVRRRGPVGVDRGVLEDEPATPELGEER